MTKTRQIPIAKPVTGEEEWQAVKEPLETGWLTSGPKVKAFEESFAEMHQVNHAVACTSATTALHLALSALEIGPGDEVIVPAFTWIATANAVRYCGADPIFVDIDLDTFNIDPAQIKEKITDRTKAIIPVHLFGLCTDVDAIKKVTQDIPIIEDAACAAGARYRGKPAGGLGDLGCFSFHPRKSITTGEGGMVTTNDAELAQRLEILRNHGASVSEEQRHKGPKPYILPEFDVMGFNYRMTDLQGAVGLVQLKKLKRFIEERDQWARFYNDAFQALDWLKTPVIPSEYQHGWQSYVTLVDEEKAPYPRNKIMELLQDKGISTRPGTHSVHLLKLYQELYDIKPEDFPKAKQAHYRSMAIPLHNQMSVEDFEYIVDQMLNI